MIQEPVEPVSHPTIYTVSPSPYTPRCFVCKGPSVYSYQCDCGNYLVCSEQCHRFVHAKRFQLMWHLEKTRLWNLPSIMTIGEVMHAFRFFNFYCAYCRVQKATELDHFVPTSIARNAQSARLRRGTEPCNIVPACHGCNERKGIFFADGAIATLFGSKAQESVKNFLATQAAYQHGRYGD